MVYPQFAGWLPYCYGYWLACFKVRYHHGELDTPIYPGHLSDRGSPGAPFTRGWCLKVYLRCTCSQLSPASNCLPPKLFSAKPTPSFLARANHRRVSACCCFKPQWGTPERTKPQRFWPCWFFHTITPILRRYEMPVFTTNHLTHITIYYPVVTLKWSVISVSHMFSMLRCYIFLAVMWLMMGSQPNKQNCQLVQPCWGDTGTCWSLFAIIVWSC